mmetsp:Transcript_26623/g.54096  ORF Transcript_26623/g.54096 Transcript_26623/m.54096 type:complete len:108 (+) Transcript_26623:1272-1595(+)
MARVALTWRQDAHRQLATDPTPALFTGSVAIIVLAILFTTAAERTHRRSSIIMIHLALNTTARSLGASAGRVAATVYSRPTTVASRTLASSTASPLIIPVELVSDTL